jgi:hypothetical protein
MTSPMSASPTGSWPWLPRIAMPSPTGARAPRSSERSSDFASSEPWEVQSSTQAEVPAEEQAEVQAEVQAEAEADGAARPSSHKAQGSEVYLAAHRPALERALLFAARPHVETRPRVPLWCYCGAS